MRKKILVHCFLFIILITIGACSSKSEDDPDIQAIETVLKKALTAPNKKLVAALLKPIEQLQSGEEGVESAVLESNKEIEILLKETYGNYFTDYGYEKFVIQQSIPSSYSLDADGAGYQIAVKDSKVIADKERINSYSFEVTLEYNTNEDETKIIVATGRVECENGKITSLDINDDKGLLEEMFFKTNKIEH